MAHTRFLKHRPLIMLYSLKLKEFLRAASLLDLALIPYLYASPMWMSISKDRVPYCIPIPIQT